MKISLEWLSDFLSAVPDADAAAAALTNGGFPVEHIETVGSDRVLDVEVTSNRGDCLSHIGVARELSALLNIDRKHPAYAFAGGEASPSCPVAIEAPDLCPHYLGRVIRNVRVAPSPGWLVRRLEAVGVRPINNIVDITNYVMFELGQPLHAFDLDRLAGPRIVVRRARAGEQIVSLDGHERVLATDMLVIADATRPIALAGVMGGRDTEVSATTKNLLLESARFDSLSVRKTARALIMKSESSYRFERGIDLTLPEAAGRRAAGLIAELAGGAPESKPAEAGAANETRRGCALRLAQLKRITGIDYDPAEAVATLQKLDFKATHASDKIEVTVPTHRLDVTAEIDLIEEIARVVGYDRIPTRDQISLIVSPRGPVQIATDEIRRTLTGSGFYEAVTLSFIADNLRETFMPRDASGLPRADASVRKADAHLRPSLLPGLLESLARNQSAANIDAWLFEIGAVFWLDKEKKLIETDRLGLVCPELAALRGAIDALLHCLDASKPVHVEPIPAAAGLAVAGKIVWGAQSIGRIGLIDAAPCKTLDLRGHPAGAELDLSPLLEGTRLVPTARPLPRFPASERDLSLVVEEKVHYAELENLIRKLEPPNLRSIRFVTTYRGKPLAAGTKSVTVTLVFRSNAGTLTGDTVDAAVATVVTAAKTQLNAALRI